MASANRETVRDALAALLEAALTGSGKPVQAVYGYLKSDLAGQSPVVMVQSAGIRREMASASDDWDNVMRFELLAWVMDANEASGWTDANVDDAVDAVEAAIADVIAANRRNDNWDELVYADEFTRLLQVTVGSTPYVLERIPVLVTVLD